MLQEYINAIYSSCTGLHSGVVVFFPSAYLHYVHVAPTKKTYWRALYVYLIFSIFTRNLKSSSLVKAQ